MTPGSRSVTPKGERASTRRAIAQINEVRGDHLVPRERDREVSLAVLSGAHDAGAEHLVAPPYAAVQPEPRTRGRGEDWNLDPQAELDSGTLGKGRPLWLRPGHAQFEPKGVNREIPAGAVRFEPAQPPIEKERPQLEPGRHDATRIGVGPDGRLSS